MKCVLRVWYLGWYISHVMEERLPCHGRHIDIYGALCKGVNFATINFRGKAKCNIHIFICTKMSSCIQYTIVCGTPMKYGSCILSNVNLCSNTKLYHLFFIWFIWNCRLLDLNQLCKLVLGIYIYKEYSDWNTMYMNSLLLHIRSAPLST